MPIQINIEGQSVAEVTQLVHDLSASMGRINPSEVSDTKDSTFLNPQQPQAAPAQPFATSTPAQAPVVQGYNNPGQAPTNQAYVQQQPANTPSPAGAVPTAPPPAYTMEQLGVAAGPLVDAGRSPELTAWINQRGAAALSQLDKSHYGEFATFLRSLGAKI